MADMSERPDIDQFADTVREALNRINGRTQFWDDAVAALDELVALARRREHRCIFPSCVEGEKPEFCGHCYDVERAEAAEARVAELERERDERGPFFVRDIARIVGLPDDASMDAIRARVAELERERDTGLWSGGDPRIVTLRRERGEAEARVAELEAALREIDELCEHWKTHDKTDPDEHERWRLAAIRRAQMIGDHARAALAGDGDGAAQTRSIWGGTPDCTGGLDCTAKFHNYGCDRHPLLP